VGKKMHVLIYGITLATNEFKNSKEKTAVQKDKTKNYSTYK